MEQYSPEDFTRQSRRVRSPIPHRRSRRLMRFAILSAAVMMAGIGLLALALGS
jgi:hypothetical protein